jgi:hypothetical protein
VTIDQAVARDLGERLRRVEERLARLLESGWRQAQAEAADLRGEADDLAEAGLTQAAARVAAVAGAASATEALPAIALATSACRLMRARLVVDGVPDGWAPIVRPKRRAGTGTHTLLPVSRLLLSGREVWACAHSTQRRWLLLEPPFPVAEPPKPVSEPVAEKGFFARLGRQISEAFGETARPAGPWIRHRLQGKLVWRARYPLGAVGDVSLYSLGCPEWVTDDGDTQRYGIHSFHYTLAQRVFVSGAPVFPMGGGFKLVELQREDSAACVWLDSSAADAFATAPASTGLAIVWMEGAAVVPVALVTRGRDGGAPSLTHLLPGTPTDVLWKPT